MTLRHRSVRWKLLVASPGGVSPDHGGIEVVEIGLEVEQRQRAGGQTRLVLLLVLGGDLGERRPIIGPGAESVRPPPGRRLSAGNGSDGSSPDFLRVRATPSEHPAHDVAAAQDPGR